MLFLGFTAVSKVGGDFAYYVPLFFEVGGDRYTMSPLPATPLRVGYLYCQLGNVCLKWRRNYITGMLSNSPSKLPSRWNTTTIIYEVRGCLTISVQYTGYKLRTLNIHLFHYPGHDSLVVVIQDSISVNRSFFYHH